MTHRLCRARSSAFALVAAVCAAAAGSSVAWGQASTPDGDGQVEAIWRAQVLDLAYSSPSYYYACDALQARIGAILQALGAHRSVKVVMGCKDRTTVKTAFARILVTTPVEATADRLTEATTFTERDVLAARLRGETLPTAADIERFPAKWREVSLSTRAPLRLEASDCDLLRDMSRQLFPKLGIELVERISCMATATRMKPEVRVKALVRDSSPVVAEAESR